MDDVEAKSHWAHWRKGKPACEKIPMWSSEFPATKGWLFLLFWARFESLIRWLPFFCFYLPGAALPTVTQSLVLKTAASLRPKGMLVSVMRESE